MAAKLGQMLGGLEGNLEHEFTFKGKKARKMTYWISLVICLIISAVILGFMYSKDKKKPKKERKTTSWWVGITGAFILGSFVLAWVFGFFKEFDVERSTNAAREWCDRRYNVEVNNAEMAEKQRKNPYYIQCVDNRIESERRARQDMRYNRYNVGWNNNRGGGSNIVNDIGNLLLN